MKGSGIFRRGGDERDEGRQTAFNLDPQGNSDNKGECNDGKDEIRRRQLEAEQGCAGNPCADRRDPGAYPGGAERRRGVAGVRPPFTSLESAAKALSDRNIAPAHDAPRNAGALTGEVSPECWPR